VTAPTEVPWPSRHAVVTVPMRMWHLRAVHHIDTQVYPTPWSFALLRQEMALRGTRCHLVAEVGSSVVGHAGIMYVVDEGHITTVAVDPAWQGRQIGVRLMLALTRHALSRPVRALTLEVRVSNTRAIDLYRRFGYAPAGVRPNYYTDVPEDALIMWAHDVDRPDYVARMDRIETELAEATERVGTEPLRGGSWSDRGTQNGGSV
jgi:ribosomal-protein-alanine N-acetyltransferase